MNKQKSFKYINTRNMKYSRDKNVCQVFRININGNIVANVREIKKNK